MGLELSLWSFVVSFDHFKQVSPYKHIAPVMTLLNAEMLYTEPKSHWPICSRDETI